MRLGLNNGTGPLGLTLHCSCQRNNTNDMGTLGTVESFESQGMLTSADKRDNSIVVSKIYFIFKVFGCKLLPTK